MDPHKVLIKIYSSTAKKVIQSIEKRLSIKLELDQKLFENQMFILFNNDKYHEQVMVVALDAKSGKELWNEKIGTDKFIPLMPWTIAKPSVIGDTLYIGAWGGEHKELKGAPAYSDLIAIDSSSGAELWRQQVDEFIMYPPAFANGKVIVTNMKEAVTAYKGGKGKSNAQE